MLCAMKSLIYRFLLTFALLPAGLFAAPSVSELAQSARDAQARGETHRAMHYLQQIIDQDPNNESALRAQARLLGAAGYPVQAAVRWAKLPQDAEAQAGMAAAAAVTQTAEAPAAVSNGMVAAATIINSAADAPAGALEPGQGVWVNGDLNTRVKAINEFNLKAPKAQRLRYVFVAAGSIHLSHGKPVLTLDLRPVRIAAAALGGESQAHVWLNVMGRGAHGLKASAWQDVAAQLATALAAEPKIGGVHLAPDSSLKGIRPLIEALRSQIHLPLSALVATATAPDFDVVDLVVLRGWGRNQDLDAYKSRIRDQVSGFMRAAGSNQAKAMVGLPVRGPQGPEFFRAGRDSIGAVLTPDQSGPMGLGLMGLVDDASGLSADWKPEVWQTALNPVAGP
jgi:hypothetical protein